MRRALTALFGVPVLLAGCQSVPERSPQAGEAPPMRLVSYSGCGDLLESLRASAAARVGPYGFDGPMFYGMDAAEKNLAASAAPASGATAPYSGTNVHESGVDEPDLVKTDGSRVFTVAEGRLQIIDAASRRVVHRLRLPREFRNPADLLISGDRALLLSSGFRMTAKPAGLLPAPGADELNVLHVDLAAPKVLGSLKAGGSLVDARQVGSVARLVLRTSPDIRFPGFDWGGPSDHEKKEKRAAELNRRAVRKAPLEAFQPGYDITVDGRKTSHRVPCERISHPRNSKDGNEINMLTVLTVDLARGFGDGDPVSVVADGDTVYGTARSLYVTGSPWRRPVTQIHKFEIGEGRPRYAASTELRGRLLNQYSMSEYEGNLRVAVTDDEKQVSTVHVLQPHGPLLREVGSLTGLGRGERIYSVRFAGPRGYVVTFRQVDPLYALDLSHPRRPRSLGELKITGYSAYLHPTAEGRLLGVGREADAKGRARGAQISLFDVTGSPRRLSRLHLPKVYDTQVEYDQHAFLHWAPTGLTVLPDSGGRALVLTVKDDAITREGSVKHPGQGHIRRSLVIGDTLWTVSSEGVKVNDAATLAQRAWIPWRH
ncbi:beta-propeller domain-containing protein [Actinocorallia sp. B10E7]|uniref:beta-propeller domain-containing protein n=1 Tax=Actinocorallia sp. B10E7 TaxID=3153558 RepID=UPI00325C3612